MQAAMKPAALLATPLLVFACSDSYTAPGSYVIDIVEPLDTLYSQPR